jgi:hypothetical protein
METALRQYLNGAETAKTNNEMFFQIFSTIDQAFPGLVCMTIER